jgi:hypothetical protein
MNAITKVHASSHVLNKLASLTYDDRGRRLIEGVTYGGIMHRFTDDQAVRDYCNAAVKGGYLTHAVLANGSTWIPDTNAPSGVSTGVQIGWTR